MLSFLPIRLIELMKFYQAALVNTFFGYGLYSFLVFLDIDKYGSQIIAHIMGSIFNYVTYSRYAFLNYDHKKSHFFFGYVINYIVGFVFLFLCSIFINSPYIAGAASLFFTSLLNFAVLRGFVFTQKRQK